MNVLNLPARKVIIENTSCGRGFGGKITRGNLVATAVARCAKILNRTVRIQTSRKQEMILAGNRSPFVSNYRVGFNDAGIINALHIKFFENTGYFTTPSISDETQLSLCNVYFFENYRSEGYVCQTNLPPNTSM